MIQKKVRKAIIPAAGLGTRFLPATKSIPKEMIPIIDKPMIQHIVEEAVASGIEEIILITARGKSSIEDHFDFAYEIEDTLTKKGKSELAKVSKDVARMCNIISVRQKEPLGLGHAVLTAQSIIGDEPFAVLLGDDLIDGENHPPCTKQLIDQFEAVGSSVVAIMEVPMNDVSKYGIMAGDEVPGKPKLIRSKALIEKPSPSTSPSRFALPGRYVFTPTLFKHLRQQTPGAGGEIQLTDAMAKLALEEPMYGYLFSGKRYDAGDRLGYIEATISFALKRPELRDAVKALLKQYSS